MNRKFTARENVLLIILVAVLLAAVYFYAVWLPVVTMSDSAKRQLSDLEISLMVEEKKADRIAQMQKAFETAEGEGNLSPIPQYDNLKNLLDELNEALESAIDFNINFRSTTNIDVIVQRNIQIQFQAESYNEARSIMAGIDSGPYRCHVIAFRIESGENELGNFPVTVMMDVIYFESD